METLVERCAGLDVHKDTVVACVRITTGRNVETQLATFGTTTVELLGLRDWLTGRGGTPVGWNPPGCIGSRCTTSRGRARVLAAQRPAHAQRPGP